MVKKNFLNKNFLHLTNQHEKLNNSFLILFNSMAKKRGKTAVYDYLERIEQHFDYLVEVKKMDSATRKIFFNQFLGCSEATYNNWWRFGVRKIYLSVLFLLDEIEEYRERIKILEKQLNELTKK